MHACGIHCSEVRSTSQAREIMYNQLVITPQRHHAKSNLVCTKTLNLVTPSRRGSITLENCRQDSSSSSNNLAQQCTAQLNCAGTQATAVRHATSPSSSQHRLCQGRPSLDMLDEGSTPHIQGSTHWRHEPSKQGKVSHTRWVWSTGVGRGCQCPLALHRHSHR